MASSKQTVASISNALTLVVAAGSIGAFALSTRPQSVSSTVLVPVARHIELIRPRVVAVADVLIAEQGGQFEPLAYRQKGRKVREPERPASTREAQPKPPSPSQDEKDPTWNATAGTKSTSGPQSPKSDVAVPITPSASPVLSVTPEAPPVAAKTEWSLEESASALKQCLRLLAPAAVDIDLSSPMRNGPCGDAAPVLLKGIAGKDKVTFSPPLEVNCQMAAELAGWVENTLQPVAREMLNSPVTKISGASGYSCRNRYGLPNAPLSEHATANAVDIPVFILADGRTIKVASSWGLTARDIMAQEAKLVQATNSSQGDKELDGSRSKAGDIGAAKVEEKEPASKKESKSRTLAALKGVTIQKLGAGAAMPAAATANTRVSPLMSAPAQKPSMEGLFLRRLAKSACATFGTVLGPESNEAHRDHFHLDLKPRRKRAFCE